MTSEAHPTIAVGAVVVKDRTLLMVRRGNDPGKGLWSIPGGRVEPGEYLVDAVAREVKEETGLGVEVGGLLGIFEVVGEPHYVILDHIASYEGSEHPVAGDDVDDVRWVGFDDMPGMDCTPRLEEALRAWGVFEDSD